MSLPPLDDDAADDTRTLFTPASMIQRKVAAARADWMHYLVMWEGEEKGRRLSFGPNSIRVGRRAPCEFLLSDPGVSGAHCEVRAQSEVDDAIVTDLGSTNGTFIDGRRLTGPAKLPPGSLLQVGRHVLKHEYRPQREVERSAELDRELETASRYVQSLLPQPIRDGPVRTEWRFQPSAELGGDAFGHFALDSGRFVGYVIDVSGHGISAAVHTVSVLNVLRQRALPGVDFGDPAQVLSRLNAMFPMDAHGGLFFTLWYGVYDVASRRLRYASAGHHPAYLVDAARSRLQPLQTRNPMVGALPIDTFRAAEVVVPPGSTLHIFSDGVYEIDTADGRQWGIGDFTPLLLQPPEPGLSEPERLFRAVQELRRPGPWADDVSLLAVTFLP